MKRITIDDATPEQVRDFARVMMGLDIGKGEHKATVLEKLASAGYTSDHITVVEAVDPKANARPGSTYSVEFRGRTYINILIPEEDKPGGEEPVPVSVNGSAMLIPRGKESLVPSEYVEVLRHAVMAVYDPVKDGLGGIRKPRHVPSYPFQTVPIADEAAALASLERKAQAVA